MADRPHGNLPDRAAEPGGPIDVASVPDAAARARLTRRSRTTRNERSVTLGLKFASYASLVLLWLGLSLALGSNVLPGPLDTLAFIVREFERGAMTHHLWITTQRVLVAFASAMVVGVTAGAAMGASKRFDASFEGWLITGLTVPRILLFVVAYLLLGLSDRALVIALIVTVVPTVVVSVREGTRAIDGGLVEMARAFRRSRAATWRHVVLPQIMPYIVGTARGVLALSWKMVVLGELLGRTSGVGYQISFYFQFFNMRGILAYGVTMMVLLAIIDLVLMGWLQRRVFRWRAPVKVGAPG
ncbi:MAG: ABC transporter permease subunit [Trueperaceae bacterium]